MQYIKSIPGGSPTQPELAEADSEYHDKGEISIREVEGQDFSLFGSGFQYLKWGGKYTTVEQVTEQVKEQVNGQVEDINVYCSALGEFIKEKLGASEVVLLDGPKIRNTDAPAGDARINAQAYAGRSLNPHADISQETADRVYEHISKPWSIEDNKRILIINAWKPLKTVKKHPLVIADPKSVSWDDFLPVPVKLRDTDINKGEGKKEVEVTFYGMKKPASDKEHIWWYMKEQTPEDVLFFMQYDSANPHPKGRTDVAHTSIVGHGSVEIPGTEEEAARESVEARFLVVL